MRLLENGASLEVSATDYDVPDLAEMVQSAVNGKTKLYIKDSEELDDMKISVISGEGKKNVVFK